ncbi:putative gnat family protein [Mycena sanguinolenta]|uniref:Putative gnat family protein n=1 Tax=Mycena sanguinolenta TaxID=230812 RepID=A0A8H6XNL6_9AGAR|nr:putative gnat family protein [Mycena sanguinolenta]
MAERETVRIRQAELADIDGVTDLLIISMPEDREWWDYRFPYRREYPDDHRQLFRALVAAWISPEFEDWVVLVAECYDESSQRWEMASYAAWDISYLNFRKFGDGYKPARSLGDVLAEAGAATRRDTTPARAAAYAHACDEAHEKYLIPQHGTAQIHLQALGTHPSFTRRGLAKALCRWGMDCADRDGVVATLVASPMGRSVYPRFGFEELGVVQAMDEGGVHGPALCAMRQMIDKSFSSNS